jgi:addiction module HigA family antidote
MHGLILLSFKPHWNVTRLGSNRDRTRAAERSAMTLTREYAETVVARINAIASLHAHSMKTSKLPPIHAGEILREEFMKPRGLSQNALARALKLPPRRINEIVLEKRGITAETALRLARYFGTSAEMWASLQADYDLRLIRYKKGRAIEREVQPLPA